MRSLPWLKISTLLDFEEGFGMQLVLRDDDAGDVRVSKRQRSRSISSKTRVRPWSGWCESWSRRRLMVFGTKTSLFMYFVFKCVGSIFSALCLTKVVAASLLQKERFHREILDTFMYHMKRPNPIVLCRKWHFVHSNARMIFAKCVFELRM